MTQKSEYIKLCNTNHELPLFWLPWFLDGLVGSNWDVRFSSEDGQLLGAWIFTPQKKYGLQLIPPVPLIKHTGIWLSDALSEPEKIKITEQLLEELPGYDHLEQNFWYSLCNWKPLYWKGFDQKTFYSQEINTEGKELENHFKTLRNNHKRNIKKGNKNLNIEATEDYSILHQCILDSYTRKNQTFKLNENQVKQLTQVCLKKNSGKILVAKYNNEICGAIFFAWDNKRVYYLLGGFNQQFASYGVSTSLIWEGIKISFEQHKIFDFEGSMNANISHFFDGFNTQLKPYFNITHTPNKLFNFYLKTFK